MKRSALPLLAGLVTLLTVLSGGVAYALWTAQTQQAFTASAASTGISQTTSFTGTPTDSYDEPSGILAHAYEVTIQNGGTRAADYRLHVTPQSPSDPGLSSAITIAIGPTDDTCAPTATLDDPQGGLLSSSPHYDGTAHGQLAPGTTVALCVISTIDSADFDDFDGAQVTLALSSELRWSSASPAWTLAASAATVLQIVTAETGGWVPVDETGEDQDPASPPAPGDALSNWMLVTHPIGRFWAEQAYRDGTGNIVVNGRVCKNGGNERPALYPPTECGDGWNSQLRPTPIPGTELREWWLLRADPHYMQPSTPAWTRTTTNNRIDAVARSTDSNAQRWHLETDGQGLYRFTAVGEPEHAPVCITASTINVWDPSGTNPPYFLTAEACDETSTRQTFRLHLVGYPLPGTALHATCSNAPVTVAANGYPLSSTGSGSTNFSFTWKECYANQSHENYQQETLYRLVFRTTEAAGSGGEPLTSVITHHYNSGNWREFQMGNNQGIHGDSGASRNHHTDLRTWWITTFGDVNGTHTAHAWVEQRITELGNWYPTTQQLRIQIARSGDSFTFTVLP